MPSLLSSDASRYNTLQIEGTLIASDWWRTSGLKERLGGALQREAAAAKSLQMLFLDCRHAIVAIFGRHGSRGDQAPREVLSCSTLTIPSMYWKVPGCSVGELKCFARRLLPLPEVAHGTLSLSGRAPAAHDWRRSKKDSSRVARLSRAAATLNEECAKRGKTNKELVGSRWLALLDLFADVDWAFVQASSRFALPSGRVAPSVVYTAFCIVCLVRRSAGWPGSMAARERTPLARARARTQPGQLGRVGRLGRGWGWQPRGQDWRYVQIGVGTTSRAAKRAAMGEWPGSLWAMGRWGECTLYSTSLTKPCSGLRLGKARQSKAPGFAWPGDPQSTTSLHFARTGRRRRRLCPSDPTQHPPSASIWCRPFALCCPPCPAYLTRRAHRARTSPFPPVRAPRPTPTQPSRPCRRPLPSTQLVARSLGGADDGNFFARRTAVDRRPAPLAPLSAARPVARRPPHAPSRRDVPSSRLDAPARDLGTLRRSPIDRYPGSRRSPGRGRPAAPLSHELRLGHRLRRVGRRRRVRERRPRQLPHRHRRRDLAHRLRPALGRAHAHHVRLPLESEQVTRDHHIRVDRRGVRRLHRHDRRAAICRQVHRYASARCTPAAPAAPAAPARSRRHMLTAPGRFKKTTSLARPSLPCSTKTSRRWASTASATD